MEYSIKTIVNLEEAGWNAHRHINIDLAKEMLVDRGYLVGESFDRFYSEFGELYLDISIAKSDRYIDFTIKNSFGIDYDELVINLYTNSIGCKYLDIIGNINGNTLLVINEENIIYMLYDGTAKIVGNSSIEAIDNLCTKDWRWFDQFELPWSERWNGLKCDFNFVRAKQIENHKKFIEKYSSLLN